MELIQAQTKQEATPLGHCPLTLDSSWGLLPVFADTAGQPHRTSVL